MAIYLVAVGILRQHIFSTPSQRGKLYACLFQCHRVQRNIDACEGDVAVWVAEKKADQGAVNFLAVEGLPAPLHGDIIGQSVHDRAGVAIFDTLLNLGQCLADGLLRRRAVTGGQQALQQY